MWSFPRADAPDAPPQQQPSWALKEIIVTASTDLTATGAGPAASSLDADSAQEMADQMADLAGAMFALLLLRAPDMPVDPDAHDAPAVEPVALPVVPEEPAIPVLVPSVPALAVALAELDLDTAPVPAGIPSLAMATSLPMPDSLPQHQAKLVSEEAVTPHTIAIPVSAPPAAPTMAMLSEIEFLDE
jgi:hypothetical protein